MKLYLLKMPTVS